MTIQSFNAANPDIAAYFAKHLSIRNNFLSDLRYKLGQYGSLTPRQIDAARTAIAREEAWESKTADERASRAPVAEGSGKTITGEVISLKEVEDRYSPPWDPRTILKMTVRDDRGFVVYGTVPSSIYVPVEIGSHVAFIANVEASKDDPTFGFFSRPRRAEITDGVAV